METFLYESPEFQQKLASSSHALGEVKWLQRITRPGQVALDIGANKGVTTVTLARKVGKTGRVYAFEPIPEHFELLKSNLERNHADNVEAEQKAVTDKVGTLVLYARGEGTNFVAGEDAPAVTVETTTVDHFLQTKGSALPGVISMDCEGSELQVLHGAEQTLKAGAPEIFCEIHHDLLKVLEQSVEDVVAYLNSLGYEVEPVLADDLEQKVDFAHCSHIHAWRKR